MIFAQNWCITRPTPARWVTPPWNVYMAKFAPAERVTRATRLGRSPNLSCKRDLIKLRDYMDRRVTSPTWDPSPPCKQALIAGILYDPCQFSRVCACLFQSQCFASLHYKFDCGALNVVIFDDHEPGPQLTFAIHRPAPKQVHLLSFTRSSNFRRQDINNIGKNTTRRTTTKYC